MMTAPPHLDWFVRGSVVLVLALALVASPLLRGRSAVARRIVLTVAFAAVMVIPLVPAWHVGGPAYQALVGRLVAEPVGSGPSSVALPPASGLPGLARTVEWVTLAWAAGVALVGARFLLGAVLALRLARRASPAPRAWRATIALAEQTSGVRAVVRVSSEIDAPAVTGVISPVTLVPASATSWTDERKLSVLRHELAHVAAHDLAVQAIVQIVCTMHWFNPLAWLAARRLRLERELAADEAVLRAGVRPSSYAADLLAIAGASRIGMIAVSEEPLAKRIAAIVAEKQPPRLGSRRVATLAAGSAAVSLAVACTTIAEAPSSKGAPAAARSLTAAIDHDLQAIAEDELDRTLKEWTAPSGTVLVMSPRGDVLASAGHPDDLYVAGSTLKAVLLAAAIDEDVLTENDVFDCTDGDRGGKTLRDAAPLGRVALPDLVARSGNIGFAQIFDRLGGARFDGALRRFSFTTPPELAAAPAGDWNAGLLAIGATMSTTPRQVTRAYAALAAGGEGAVKPSTATRVGTLLEGVVASEHGTGRKARVAGFRVAGKTGSSEWTTAAGARVTYASFVGYVPVEHPRYVIFVGVESPGGVAAWGGEVAAPVFGRVAARALRR